MRSHALRASIDYNSSHGNDAFTKLLLHFDGANGSTSAVDSSSSANVFGAYGNAKISTANYKFGGASALFDGSGDFFVTSNPPSLNLGSGDWTFDCWVRPTTHGVAQTIFCRIGSTSPYSGYYLRISSSNTWELTTNNNTAVIISSATSVLNVWQHVAIVRSGTTITMYIDGASEGSWTGNLQSTSYDFVIGIFANSTQSFAGYIDEFRVSVGVARWTSAFTPPTMQYS